MDPEVGKAVVVVMTVDEDEWGPSSAVWREAEAPVPPWCWA